MPILEDLANHKAGDIQGLKPKFLKWVVTNLFVPITKPFNIMAKEGFQASWTINIIQMIFTSSEILSLEIHTTIMLGAIIGKL